MAKRALCVGINKYPRPELELRGCVNDAKGWAAVLTDRFDVSRADVKLLTDKQATKAKMLAALDSLLTGARRGDLLVFTNSSHGTYVADKDGDERLYDEAICPWDCDERLIVDDELRERFANVPSGVRLVVISDSCHSGSVTRAVDDLFAPDRRQARFVNPRDIGLPEIPDMRTTARPRNEGLHPESEMRDLLLSGCRSDQYSYDARIGGKFHGAMSYFAQAIIGASPEPPTWTQLHRALRAALRDANYDQEPQLEARASAKRRRLFS